MMLVDSVPSVDDNACIYDIHPPSLQYFAVSCLLCCKPEIPCSHWILQGMPAICVSFVGYLWIGTQPMLHPLYVSMQLMSLSSFWVSYDELSVRLPIWIM